MPNIKRYQLTCCLEKFGIFIKMSMSSSLLFFLLLARSLAFSYALYISLLPNNQLLLYALPQSPLSLIPDPSAPAPPPSLLSGLVVCVSDRAGSQWYYYRLLLVTSLPTSDEVNHMDSFAAGFSERVLRVNEPSCFPFRGEGEIE